MASRYVPPALRRKSGQTSEDNDTSIRIPRHEEDTTLRTLFEIQRHFWPVEDPENDHSKQPHNTLNAAANAPSQLSHIILFPGANPRWDSDRIIFAKTNVELLDQYHRDAAGDENPTKPVGTSAGDESTAVDAEHPPIAVFSQVRGGRSGHSGRNFSFTGWFMVERVQILAPRSPELVRMLDQKWSMHGKQRQRDPSAWQSSLSLTWAVIKFAPDSAADQAKGQPDVQRLSEDLQKPLPSTETKSVNEMLAELRVQPGRQKTDQGVVTPEQAVKKPEQAVEEPEPYDPDTETGVESSDHTNVAD